MTNTKKSFVRLKISFAVLLLFACNAAMAWVKLPAIFGDGMVLQQQTSVPVWGWANPGESISIEGSWGDEIVKTSGDISGHWVTNIKTPAAGGPYTLTVTGENTIELKDVLVGEVWVASGQSNMGFTMKSDAEAKTEVPSANYPNLRYFYVERQYGLNKFADAPGSVWKPATPKNVPDFSAVAYYFAKKIQAEKNVPVGIVFSAWGGTPAEAWTPRNVLSTDTTLTKYIARWQVIENDASKDSATYQHDLMSWKKDSSIGKMPEEPKTFYYYKRPWREPSVLFNGMIDPIIPFAVKGVLWYQGESNVGYSTEYYDLFSKMIQSWRAKWGRPEMPFYFVQISAYGYEDLQAAAEVREAQYDVMKHVPNTAMAVSIDKGDMKNIHYTHKREIGNRLALIALAKNYGEDKLNFKGPEFSSAKIEKNKLVLQFNSASTLAANNEVKGLEVGYAIPGSEDLRFIKATGVVNGNTIVINTNKKDKVAVIRYGWLYPGEANLFDAQGLPAFPFSEKIKN